MKDMVLGGLVQVNPAGRIRNVEMNIILTNILTFRFLLLRQLRKSHATSVSDNKLELIKCGACLVGGSFFCWVGPCSA